MQVRYEAARWSAFYGRTWERYPCAETLRDVLPLDVAYVAPAHLRRAEILERLGRRDEAAARYARFVDLSSDAPPPLRAAVQGAGGAHAEASGGTPP